jgi:hypothetical protein
MGGFDYMPAAAVMQQAFAVLSGMCLLPVASWQGLFATRWAGAATVFAYPVLWSNGHF